MAHPRTQPMELPGWVPLQSPTPRRGAGELVRWLWPATVLAGYAALAAYVLASDPRPGPGVSVRGLVTLALAVIVLATLTLRRRWGPLAVARTLAEYAAVAVLASLLVTAGGPQPSEPAEDRPGRRPSIERPTERPQPAEHADAGAGDRRPGIVRVVTGAWDWLVDLWRQADANADRRSSPSSTTAPR